MPSTTRSWPPEVAERLADYVTALRRRADLSQRELAARAGVPATTVAHLDVAPAVEDWLRPWWLAKRGDYTFIRNRRRCDEVRAEYRDMVERYLADRERVDRDW